jgi:ADP-dependent NAD(P)H-hydrate dehydratase / NAD(P)H-hydrate epimerase
LKHDKKSVTRLVTVEQMQAVEKEADAKGLTYEKMMQNAGKGLAGAVMDWYGNLEDKSALALVGSGNNGGDALVALAELARNGWQVTALELRPRPDGDSLVQDMGAARREDLSGLDAAALKEEIDRHSILMDGLLGTGFRLPLRDDAAQVMERVQYALEKASTRPYIVAVDCPSGVDLYTGEAAPHCLPADLTVTMAAVKTGMLSFPAYNYVGELQVVGIGPVEDLESWQSINSFVPDADWVGQLLPERPLDSHKGTFGTVLVAAGSVNYTGAALLAGEAAYRCGAGLVTMAVPGPLHAALAGQFLEATWVLLPHDLGVISRGAAAVLRENMERATALVLGPGFGLEETTRDFLSHVLGSSSPSHRVRIGFNQPSAADPGNKSAEGNALPPVVIDADGLKLLPKIRDWQKLLPPGSIITPHPGEMGILTKMDKDEIQKDRLNITRRYAEEWGQVVVLKGAFTVVAAPGGEMAVIPVASPALARAGTGDVLTGLVAGLRAQGMPAFEAAVAGSWIHAQAGLSAAESMGSTASVLAGDVLNAIPDVMTALEVDRRRF